jgi:hypothetical protein
MSEEVEIVVTLSSEWHMKPPKFKLFIDDELISHGFLEEKYKENKSKDFKWIGNLEEGSHKIRLEMFGKLSIFTAVDEDRNILKDQLLKVNEISIDQIDLGNLIYQNCKFYPDKNFHSEVPEIITNIDHIGFNGTWEMEFSVPTYIWLLENL